VTSSLPVTAPAGTVPPSGAGYDIVLLLHVAAVVVSLLAVVVCGVQAARVLALGPGRPVPETLLGYYRPGVNWAGRTLHLVPVLGFALVAMSRGTYGLDDAWVLAGLLVWLGAAGLAEGVLWPAERRVQAHLAAARPVVASPGDEAAPVRPGADEGCRRDCRIQSATASLVVVLLIVAIVLMVGKP
jgi:hypothetical protein